MKKLLYTLSLALIMITLTGCFGNDVIDQISEEYCRNNPDSEICEGSVIEDLENTTVQTFFENVVNSAVGISSNDVCDNYFSVTNIALLDECRSDLSALIPDDITDFNFESITKKNDLEHQNLYTIFLVNDARTQSLEFTIGVTMVENTMYIDEWSFIRDQIEFIYTLAEAQLYFSEFTSDYVDTNISSNTFCDTYFYVENSNDLSECIAMRDETLSQVNGVNLISVVSTTTDNEFEVEFEFLITEGNTYFTVTALFHQTDDGILVEFTGEPTMPDVSAFEAQAVLQGYINDYTNPDITAQEVIDAWLPDDDMFLEGFEETRNQDLSDGVSVTIINVTKLTDEFGETIFNAAINLTINGETTTQEIEFYVFIDYLGKATIIPMWEDGGDDNFYIDFNDAESFVINVIDYINNGNAPEYVCDVYFNTYGYEVCVDLYNYVETEMTSITINNFYEQWADGIQYFMLDLSIGSVEVSYIVNFYEINNNLYVQFESVLYNDLVQLSYLDSIPVLEAFLNDFLNSQLSDLYINDQYFGGTADSEAFAMRYDMLVQGLLLMEVSSISETPYYFGDEIMYKVSFSIGDGTNVYYGGDYFFAIYSFDDGSGTYIVEIEEIIEVVDYDTAQAFMNSFFGDYINVVLSDYYLEMYYGDEFTLNELQALRQGYIELITMDALVFYDDDYGGHYEVTFWVNETPYTYLIFFNLNENGEIVNFNIQTINFDNKFELDYNTAANVLNQFFIDYLDPSITNDYLAEQYFGGMYMDDMFSIRQTFLGLNGTVTYFNLGAGIEYNIGEYYYPYSVVITVGASEMPQEGFVKIWGVDNDGVTTYIIEFIDGNVEAKITQSAANDLVNSFVTQLQINNLDTAVCTDFIASYMVNDCIGLINTMVTSGHTTLDIINLTWVDAEYPFMTAQFNFHNDDYTYSEDINLEIHFVLIDSIWYMDYFMIDINQNYTELNYENTYYTLDLFLFDMLTPYLDDSTIMYQYFLDEYITEAFDIRSQLLNDGAYVVDIQLYDYILQENGEYYYSFSVTFESLTGPYELNGYIRIFEVDDGGLITYLVDIYEANLIYMGGNQITSDEAQLMVEQFVNELNINGLYDISICNTYASYDTLIDCYSALSLWSNYNYTTIELYDFTWFDEVLPYAAVTFRVSDFSNDILDTFMVNFVWEDNGWKLELTPVTTGYLLDYYSLNGLVSIYLADYFSPDITTDYLIDTYLGGFYNQEYVDLRNMLMYNSANLVSVTILLDTYEVDGVAGYYIVEYTYFDGTTTINDSFYVKGYSDTLGSTYLEIIAIIQDFTIDYTAAESIVLSFMSFVNNPGYSSEDFCSWYFNPTSEDYQSCIDLRDETIFINGQLVVLNNYYDDLDENGVYHLVLDFNFGDANYIFRAYFTYDDLYETWFMHFDMIYNDDFEYVEYNVAASFIEAFLTDYLDPTIDDQTLADVYFRGELDPIIFDGRGVALTMGYSLINFDMPNVLIPYGDYNYYIASYTYSDGTNILDSMLNANVMVDAEDLLFLILVFDDISPNTQIDPLLAEQMINEFIVDFNNYAMASSQVCSWYFETDNADYMSCVDTRDQMIIDSVTMDPNEILPLYNAFGELYYYIDFQYAFSGLKLDIYFYQDEIDQWFFTLEADISMHPTLDYLTISGILEGYMLDYFNPLMTDADLGMIYFNNEYHIDLFGNRADLIGDGYLLSGLTVNPTPITMYGADYYAFEVSVFNGIDENTYYGVATVFGLSAEEFMLSLMLSEVQEDTFLYNQTDATAIAEELLLDFINLDSDFCSYAVDPSYIMECDTFRTDLFNLGLFDSTINYVVVNSVIYSYDENSEYWAITFEFWDYADLHYYFSFPVEIYITPVGDWYLVPHYIEVINWTLITNEVDATTALNVFINDYKYSPLANEEFCDLYFNVYENCYPERAIVVNDTFFSEIVLLQQGISVDSEVAFTVSLEFMHQITFETYYVDMIVKMYSDGNGNYVFEFTTLTEEQTTYTEAELNQMIQIYLNDFINPAILSNQFYTDTLGLTTVDLELFRNDYLTVGAFLAFPVYLELDYETENVIAYDVVVEMIYGGIPQARILTFEFYKDPANGIITSILIPNTFENSAYGGTAYPSAVVLLDTYSSPMYELANYITNPGTTATDLCALYFPNNIETECADILNNISYAYLVLGYNFEIGITEYNEIYYLLQFNLADSSMVPYDYNLYLYVEEYGGLYSYTILPPQ